MSTTQAFLDISRTALAAATCVYFLGARLKQVETRRRNVVPFIWLLVTILLVSVTEATVMIVRSSGLPDIQPMAATFLYILGLLFQIDYLWNPTNEEKKLTWHALLGSWTIMALFEIISIVEFAAVSHSSMVDRFWGTVARVAAGLRLCIEIVLFVVLAWPDREGSIRLIDNDVMGDTTVVSNRSGGGDRRKDLRRSIQEEIEAAGGTWPWLRKFRIFLPWIWPSGMPWEMMLRIVVVLLLRQVQTALAVYTPYAYGASIETIVSVFKGGEFNPFWKAQLLLLVLNIANSDGGISGLRNLLLLSFEQFREEQAQGTIYAHIMNHDATFHDVTSSSDINDASDRGVNVCEALDSLIWDIVPQIIQFMTTGITIISLYGSHVALIQLTVTSIYVLVSIRSNRMLLPIWDERITARQEMRRRRKSGIEGWQTVVQYAQAGREIANHASSLKKYMKLAWKVQMVHISGRFCLNLIVRLGECGMMALVILREVQIGGTVGSVVAFTSYWSLLQSPLLFFIRLPETIIRDLYAADRLRRIMEAEPSMKYGFEDLHLTGPCIELRDVTFSYTNNKPIFRNLNLTLEAGTTTAFVGPSGVGKTSLLDLISRKYDPQEGSVEIDGQDIKKLRRDILAQNIAIMSQSPHLFNITVGDNIKYSRPNATVSHIHRAAKRAGIHSFIVSLQNGYDTMVEEGGKNFSGGQRQQIALARTLIMDSASILLFDEPTSALDPDSEALVKETLKTEFAGTTKLIIAHRLSSIKHADRIIVFKKGEDGCGEIAEEGTHDELLKQNGIYARLCRKQTVLSEAEETHVEELFERL